MSQQVMDQQKQALGRVSQQAQLMYALLEEGPQVTRYFQQDRTLADGREWKWSRADYPTRPRTELEEQGLIRSKRKTGAARVYEVTPVQNIERQREIYRNRQVRTRQLGRAVTGLSARIAKYRKEEKELGLTARAQWIERRRRIVEISQHLKVVRDKGMIFWEQVPRPEVAWVYEEVLSMRELANDLLNDCDALNGDTETRALIAQLRNPNGRTPQELLAYNAKADELEAKLDG
jgi:hypothetical protein